MKCLSVCPGELSDGRDDHASVIAPSKAAPQIVRSPRRRRAHPSALHIPGPRPGSLRRCAQPDRLDHPQPSFAAARPHRGVTPPFLRSRRCMICDSAAALKVVPDLTGQSCTVVESSFVSLYGQMEELQDLCGIELFCTAPAVFFAPQRMAAKRGDTSSNCWLHGALALPPGHLPTP